MDQQPNIVVHAGTVEDWMVENRAQEDHIFHIHQLHFQVLEVEWPAGERSGAPRHGGYSLLERQRTLSQREGAHGFQRPEHRRHLRLSLPHSGA